VPVVCRFARRPITSSTSLKNRVDNTSPCLNPCRVSKDSEQSFCILTQHNTIVSVALVRRFNFVWKLSSDIPTYTSFLIMVSYAALKSLNRSCVVMLNSLHFSKIWRSAKSWSVVV
jgi:hypothetical protein